MFIISVSVIPLQQERTLAAIDEKFATWLPSLKWLNLGGGHLMTRKD